MSYDFVSFFICYNCYSLPSDDASSGTHAKRAKQAVPASVTPEFVFRSPVVVRFVVFFISNFRVNDVSNAFFCSSEPAPSHISEGRSESPGYVSLLAFFESFLPSYIYLRQVRSPTLVMIIMRRHQREKGGTSVLRLFGMACY